MPLLIHPTILLSTHANGKVMTMQTRKVSQ